MAPVRLQLGGVRRAHLCRLGHLCAQPAAVRSRPLIQALALAGANGATGWVGNDQHNQQPFAAGDFQIWYGEDIHDGSQQDNHGATCVDIYYLAVSTSQSECLSKDPQTMKKIEAHSIRGEVDPVTLANHANR